MMIPRSARPALAALAPILVLIAPAVRADPLQQQVLAAARAVSPEDFAFQRSIRVVQTGLQAETAAIVDRFDPARPAAERWTLVSKDGRPPTAKEVADARKAAARQPVPSYGRIANWFGAPAERVSESGDRVVYRFKSLPKGTLMMGSHDASADTSAEATVVTSGPVPYVERVRLLSTKPFRMMMVAKIERLEASTRYRLLPDGRPVPVENAFEMTGSAMGKAGSMKSVTVLSEHKPVRPPRD